MGDPGHEPSYEPLRVVTGCLSGLDLHMGATSCNNLNALLIRGKNLYINR